MNFANSFVSQEQSNKERLMGVLYTALIGFGCISHSLQKGYLYTYTYVGLSALLVSTTWAMPEPLHCGTSDRTGSTFYVYIPTIVVNHANMVAVGKKEE